MLFSKSELNALKENNCQRRLQVLLKLSFKNESDIKIFGQAELRICYQHTKPKDALQQKKHNPR